MSSEGSLDFEAIDCFWSRPTLGRLEDDHRPARSHGVTIIPSILLDSPDVLNGLVQDNRHEIVHLFRVIALHKVRRPAATAKKLLQFVRLNASQDSWVADLVAIEVENRQDGSVGNQVEQFVRLPSRRQRASFRFAIANDAGDNQVGIVESRSEGMA